MAKLDRLGWAAGLTVTSYGVRVGIRISDASAAADLLPRLPPGSVPDARAVVGRLYSYVVGGDGPRPGVRRMHLVYADANAVARTKNGSEALDALESDLRLYVAERARHRVFVHAGVVGWRGRAIVIPGRSHSGKSRLVHALVRAGATYYSDEYAVVDARGRVHAYPAPLSWREADDAGPVRRIRADELDGESARPPLPLGLVVVTSYQADVRWRPRPLTRGEGVLALLGHTVPARKKPEVVMQTLSRAMSTARALKGTRGEAEHVARAVLPLAIPREEGAA